MIKNIRILMILFCALLAGCNEDSGKTTRGELASERIQRTGIIHCGYSLWVPLMTLDPNTKVMSGIFHDVMEEVGKRLGFKIIWQEELGWGSAVIEAIRSKRVDMSCAGYWLHPNRIRAASSSRPLFYTPLYVWGQGDDTRVKTQQDINSPDYTFALVDGSGSQLYILSQHFPKAKILSLPESTTNGELIATVSSGKADFFLEDISTFDAYLKDNPGTLKRLFPQSPLALLPAVMLMPADDPRLKEMLDAMLTNIELDGTLDIILEKYGVSSTYARNPRPYTP